jgi:acetyl esterase
MDVSRLHPQSRAALGVQQREPLTVDNLAAVRRSMVAAAPDEVGAGRSIREVADIDAGGVPARLYKDETEHGVLVYAHGGGWVMGDLDTHDGMCRELAAVTGWTVISVGYRLAPESPYPAACDDLDRAVQWAQAHTKKTAVGGDSAGGLLAVTAAKRARDAGQPVVAQVLICPVLDPAMDYPDLDDYGLHREEMAFFWDAFAPSGIDRSAADLDPLRSPLEGMPPALVITAELDVLRDEGERYAARLGAAGTRAVCTRYQGMVHNFPRKLALFDAAHVALGQIAAALRHWS